MKEIAFCRLIAEWRLLVTCFEYSAGDSVLPSLDGKMCG